MHRCGCKSSVVHSFLIGVLCMTIPTPFTVFFVIPMSHGIRFHLACSL